MSLESPRATTRSFSHTPQGICRTFSSHTKVSFDGVLICVTRPGTSQEYVKRRSGYILGVDPTRLIVAEKDEEELAVYIPDGQACARDEVTSPEPFSPTPTTFILYLSGEESVELPGNTHPPLVYELLAKRLCCSTDEIRLVYPCRHGCMGHKRRSWFSPFVVDLGEDESDSPDITSSLMCPLLGPGPVQVLKASAPAFLGASRFSDE